MRALRIGHGGKRIPNTFAYVAMFAWPLVCVGLFVLLPLESAAIWSMLGAYLLLPANMSLDAPLLPPLDRMAIASISAFVLCWMKGARVTGGRPPPFLLYVFCFGLVLAPILTSLDNSYELANPKGSIPGFYPLDGLKVAGREFIALLPLFMSMSFLSTSSARATLVRSLPAAFLFYSIPMLFEIRISPQLHRWVYGYMPSNFIDQIRGGGFRPVVFIGHGLEVAFIVCLALLMSLVMIRAKLRVHTLPTSAVSAYLSGLLVLCKSLGPVIYVVVLAPMIFLTRPRTWVRISFVALLIVCAYPSLRWHGLVPVDRVASLAKKASPERSESFDVRVTNEKRLLAKAYQKPLYGWGGWGRNRVYDAESGNDISITDGEWIIQFGTYGWFGYLSLFGLLATAVFSAVRSIGPEVTPESLALGGVTLALTVQVVDMLPNASTMALLLMFAGSIAAGQKVGFRRTARQASPVSAEEAAPVTA